MSARVSIVTVVTVIIAFMCTFAMNATIYHNETKKVTNFDYKSYEYTYIEDGVEKTAKLTDVATTPEQMKALIKAIYTDPTIPGAHYAYDFDGTQVRKIDYNAYARSGWKASSNNMLVTWDDADAQEVIPNPEQDGMTLLLVNVKKSWARSRAKQGDKELALNEAIESIKLMPNFTRVNDPENPGYLYSFEGVTNRFFFISKGKPRATKWAPFYRLFEQISPVKGEGGSNSNDFIEEIKAGHAYPCYHDCVNVIGYGNAGYDHWFEIASSGEAYALNNLSIFIPDRRLECAYAESLPVDQRNNTSDDDNYEQIFKNYENDEGKLEILPKVLKYTADLNASASPSDDEGYYNVSLNWSTSFTKENLGVEVPQHFYVYEVDGNNRIRLESVVEQPTKAREHTYQVQQTTDPQTLYFVITAHPINYDNDGNIILDSDGNPLITISAESPVRSVTIPGHSPFFTEASEFRSRYEVRSKAVQVNVYKNKIAIRPTSNKDFVAIKNNQEEYELTRTDADGNKVTVATVKFTPDAAHAGYTYVVDYNEATQVTSILFDDEEPLTSGTLSDFEHSTVYVIDRFTASTEFNDHSNKYIYLFEQNDNDEYKHYSNSYVVPVYKTTNFVSSEEHTLAEIWADTDHSAKATPSNSITFYAMYDPAANLTEYDIYRLNRYYSNIQKIGKAEHYNNSGEYHVFALNDKGQLNEQIGVKQIGLEGGELTALDVNSSSNNQNSLYVPVITTLYEGNLDKENTYGCEIKTMLYPELQLGAKNLEKTLPFAGPGCSMMGYKVELSLTPRIPQNFIKNVYYYRIWRVIDGETTLIAETLLNTEEDKSDGDLWGTGYYKIKDTYPGNDPILEINDIFIDYALNNDSKKVTYIARLYTTNEDEAPLVNEYNLMSVPSLEDRVFFIAEDEKEVTFNNGTITAVETLDTDAQVVGVTYYNAMGVASNRPHSGINIVVTRYDNGKTTIQKLLNP